MKNLIVILVTLLISALAFANEAGGEHGGGHEGIPVKLVTYQAINVAIIVIGLIYFLRGPLRAHFKTRKEMFLSAATKAEEALKQAEQERSHIELKLAKLEGSTKESIQKAKLEAQDMRAAMLKEAESISKRIKEEAEAAAKFEVLKAKNQLRKELIDDSIKSAREQLTTKVSNEDHERLQNNFVEQIQVVQK
jgi:F-type H+-transporting ATPase subunit b